MKKIVLFLVVLSLAFLANAQTFFDKGESGFTAYGSVTENYWKDGYIGGLEYTYKGIIDIIAYYGYHDFDKDNFVDEGLPLTKTPGETEIEGGLEYWFLRTDPSKDRDISVGVWAEYGIGNYKDFDCTLPGQTTYEATDWTAFSTGFDFSIKFAMENNWFLQPFWWIGETWVEDNFKVNDAKDSNDLSGTYTGFGLVLQKKLPCGNSIFFSPEIDMNDLESANNTAFIMSVGYNYKLGK
ncbi:MAG TPA: hypothetical protein PLD62_04505 [Candidatus Cloacimonadota bacterium]|nr:hypothetical protein [Candidatus Cloacimonadota bacterium]